MKRFALTWRPDKSILGALESEEQPIWDQLGSFTLGMSRFWLEKAEKSVRLSWRDLESMNISNIFLFQSLETASKWIKQFSLTNEWSKYVLYKFLHLYLSKYSVLIDFTIKLESVWPKIKDTSWSQIGFSSLHRRRHPAHAVPSSPSQCYINTKRPGFLHLISKPWTIHSSNYADIIDSLRNPFWLVLVNICQKHLFLHQLTHNMTIDCSLYYEFST